MNTYKFVTTISKEGIIRVPVDPALYDKEVEITIVPKQTENIKEFKAADFVITWAGYLKNTDISGSKRDYLSEKYK